MKIRIAMGKLCVLSLSMIVISLFNFCNDKEAIFAETAAGVAVGQKAPSFKLSNIEGDEFELESFRKDKHVLLVFSATWCPACRHEIPLLKEYYDEYKDDGFEIVSIDIGESASKVKSFVKKSEINYNVILDEEAVVAKLYKVIGIPLNIVLDKSGIIIYKDNVPPDKDFIKDLFVN